MRGKGRGKRIKIAIGVIVAIAAVMGITFWRDVPPGSLLDRWFRADQGMEMDYGPATAMVTRQDVEQIYQSNGSIISNESMVVNAESSEGGSTSGYVVDKVDVKVGDEVQAGDVLFTLDMTATENDLALKQKQIALQQSSNAIDTNATQRALQNQQVEQQAQAESDTRKLQESADDLNLALADDIEAAARVRTLIEQENVTKAAYTAAQSTFDDKKSDYEDLQDEVNDIASELAGMSPDDENYAALQQRSAEKSAALSEASTDMSRAQEELSEKQSTYEAALSARETAESTLSDNDKTILSNYRSLVSQGESVESNQRAQAEALAQQQDAVAKQNIANQSSLLEQQEAIRTAEEKLAMNTVTAPISGTVTTVNVLDGQIYNGTRAVVIQNLDSMRATAEISETQIADLPVGTKVRVKTDATGDEELEGEITFVSPVPTSQQGEQSSDSSSSSGGSSGTKAKYQVNVSIDGDTSRLFIGMTAKLSFILQSNKDTLAVPTSAIQDDGMGGKFVTVVQGDGSDLTNTVDVMIETGAVGDMMTAVTSGNLNEGDTIIDYGSSYSDDGSADLSMDGIY